LARLRMSIAASFRMDIIKHIVRIGSALLLDSFKFVKLRAEIELIIKTN
jgi:hypothetical protein